LTLNHIPYQNYPDDENNIENQQVFENDICLNHMRPTIDENIPKPVENFLKSLWTHQPVERPDFATIVTDIDNLIIEGSINNSSGRTFWRECFTPKIDVRFKDFLSKLKSRGIVNKFPVEVIENSLPFFFSAIRR